MRPKIVNNSWMRTDDLKRFAYAVLDRYGGNGVVDTITFERNRTDFFLHGEANAGDSGVYNQVRIWMPRGWADSPNDRRELAQILWHECGHCTGLDHRDMTHGEKWWRIDVPWHQEIQTPIRWRKKDQDPPELADLERRIRVLMREAGFMRLEIDGEA